MFDGIFRKWVFPSLSSPIMIIKQVIGILIFFRGINYFMNSTIYEKSFFLLGIILFCTSLIFGHGNVLVAIYGCLPYWFGLSVCYIISRVITMTDFYLMCKILIYIWPFNALLMILQFSLPTGHWLNATGSRNDELSVDAAIGELGGLFRPSGIFMNDLILSNVVIIITPLILYFIFFKKDIINRKILILAYLSCWIVSIFGVSRTCVFYCVGSTLYFFVFFFGIKKIGLFLKYIFIILVAVIIFFTTPLGETAINNMSNRFDTAAEVSSKSDDVVTAVFDDIYSRNIAYLINAIVDPKTLDGESVPILGFGQGLSTQVGGRIINNGKIADHSGFALAEWDGLRIICESGTLLGLCVLFVRLMYVFRYLPKLFYFRRKKMYLTLALYPSFFFLFYVLSTWGNVTTANCAYLIGGLFLFVLNYEKCFDNSSTYI